MSIDEFSFSAPSQSYSGLAKREGHSKLIICLHGYLDNAASFVPLMNEIKGFDLIALDLTGHGRAPHRSLAHTYHLSDYAYDLVYFLTHYKHQGDTKVYLLGHSLGGIIGSLLVATYPELFHAFISIEACGPLSESENTTVKQLRASFDSRRRFDEPATQDKRSFEALVEARMKISNISYQNAELILNRNCEPNGDCVSWHSDRKLKSKSPMRMTEAQALNVLASIPLPMALFLADNGFEKIKNNLNKRIDAMQCLVNVKAFKGSHHVHMQACKEIAQETEAFFNNFHKYSLY